MFTARCRVVIRNDQLAGLARIVVIGGYFLLIAAAASFLHASTVITGTITLTNSDNLTGINAETVTINADTRTWTNAVSTPASQILVGTNIATHTQYLLTQLFLYPVSDLELSGNGNSYVTLRTAAGGALSITLYPTNWGSVTYVTNTYTTAQIVRIPHSVETAANKTNIANGLAAYLNLAANTTGLSATKLNDFTAAATLTNVASGVASVINSPANTNGLDGTKLTGSIPLATFQDLSPTLTGTHTFVGPRVSTMVTNSLASTNLVVDFSRAIQTINALATFQILQTTNRPSPLTNVLRSLLLINNVSGSNISVVINSAPGWRTDGIASPVVVTNGDCQTFQFLSRGPSETNVLISSKWFH